MSTAAAISTNWQPGFKVMSDIAEGVTRTDICTLTAARRVAVMLGQEPDAIVEGMPLPPSWHFFLLGAETRRSELRSDGFPGLGVPMPDLGLPRLLIVGRTVAYLGDIPVGATVTRTSAVNKLTEKTNDAGPMAIVTLGHELQVVGAPGPAIVETQTYFLLPASRWQGVSRETQTVTAAHTKIVTPDDTLLFQYSALGFNSHKIHIDKVHAREVEGFPDLVVNGGLTGLLLTEFARNDLGLHIRSMKMKNVAPLFSGREMTLAADHEGDRWRLRAHDDMGHLAAEMEVETR